ncbi:MAG: D-alanyl-D-alanine carboxypeptidase family protein [Paracoccaceae bacterium]
MHAPRIRPAVSAGLLTVFLILSALSAGPARAAPYAAMVMDARTGEVLHSRNADTRLHPASLTKMMTLYIAFQAVERGEIGLDTMVTVPRAAAAEPPSRLGLRAGSRIAFRHLIRAAAIKSANDAATTIAFAISGSEAAFTDRMTRTAQAMGMSRTRFLNAHGLTEQGHYSTARDMNVLGRHLIYDWPEYYGLFSRSSVDAGIAQVRNTNRRFLGAYAGADGIKTGYTRAAGYNLTASAQRGSERIVATIFGGTSSGQRARRMAQLMDMGFQRAPTRVALQRPVPPGPQQGASTPVAVAAVTRSLRPTARTPSAPVMAFAAPPAPPVVVDTSILAAAIIAGAAQEAVADIAAEVAASPPAPSLAPERALIPRARPQTLSAALPAALEIVETVSTSGARHWGVTVGRFTTRDSAERALVRVAMHETATLGGAARRVLSSSSGHDAHFAGLTRDGADLACRRLAARGTACTVRGPGITG